MNTLLLSGRIFIHLQVPIFYYIRPYVKTYVKTLKTSKITFVLGIFLLIGHLLKMVVGSAQTTESFFLKNYLI